MDVFAEKMGCFSGDSLGEEFGKLSEHLAEGKALITATHVQYVESAMAYALAFLRKPDEGASEGKSPARLCGILSEQYAALAAQENGVQESLVQPNLLGSAKKFLS